MPDGDGIVRKAVGIEDLFGALGIVDHDADDRRVGRVHEAERHDMDIGLAEGFDELMQTADLVLHKDGELAHSAEVWFIHGFRAHLCTTYDTSQSFLQPFRIG